MTLMDLTRRVMDDQAFRRSVVNNPNGTLASFGLSVAEMAAVAALAGATFAAVSQTGQIVARWW
jgi:hypothetical protein